MRLGAGRCRLHSKYFGLSNLGSIAIRGSGVAFKRYLNKAWKNRSVLCVFQNFIYFQRYYIAWKTAHQKMYSKEKIIAFAISVNILIYLISIFVRICFSYYKIPNSISVCAGLDYEFDDVEHNFYRGPWVWALILFIFNFSGFVADILLIQYFRNRRKTQPLQLVPWKSSNSGKFKN